MHLIVKTLHHFFNQLLIVLTPFISQKSMSDIFKGISSCFLKYIIAILFRYCPRPFVKFFISSIFICNEGKRPSLSQQVLFGQYYFFPNLVERIVSHLLYHPRNTRNNLCNHLEDLLKEKKLSNCSIVFIYTSRNLAIEEVVSSYYTSL